MAPRIVEGIYRGGQIELAETPDGIAEGVRVRVEFLPRELTDEERRAAGDRLMARMRQGIDFGGSPYPSRESLYDRDEPR